jgi:hypothetical protein
MVLSGSNDRRTNEREAVWDPRVPGAGSEERRVGTVRAGGSRPKDIRRGRRSLSLGCKGTGARAGVHPLPAKDSLFALNSPSRLSTNETFFFLCAVRGGVDGRL